MWTSQPWGLASGRHQDYQQQQHYYLSSDRSQQICPVYGWDTYECMIIHDPICEIFN